MALAVVVATGCSEPAPQRSAVLIVVDTLRWDYLGSYGHPREISPSLDALAAEGVRFERAYSTAPWTKPAVASLLTGLYPSAHWVRTMNKALPESVTTTAEILSSRGFQTGAVVSHILIAKSWDSGLDQGFEIFLEEQASSPISTPAVTDAAIRTLESFRSDGRPFFLFVHYFDPHYEYLAHEEYGFAAERAGRLDGSRGIIELRELRDSLSEEELEFLRDRYAEEVRFTDAGIGRLLASLDRLGLRDETVVVVTADHGEEFMERGWLGHTQTLYEELLRVPLIVRAPGWPSGRVVRAPVSTVSVAATLLDLLGVDPDDHALQGVSLAQMLENDIETASESWVFGEVDFKPEHRLHEMNRAFKKTLVGTRYKVIRDDVTRAVEIYDLQADPLEETNLASQRPKLRAELTARLDREMDRVRR